MARVSATQIENNFIKGLVTEATGLNFPENSCTETYNCEFQTTGEVTRRRGFDAQTGSTSITINRNNVVTAHYLWIDAGGDGTTTFIVQQIGSTLRFYNTTAAGTIVAGLHVDTVDLTDFSPVGAPSPATKECQFSSGNGFLFVTHPNLEPFYVSFDASSDNIASTQIDVKIRDFEGEKSDSNYDDVTRPSSLTNAHKYNLLNQGWTNDLLTQWFTWVTISGTTTSGNPNITAMTFEDASHLVVGMLAQSGANGISGKTITSVSPSPPYGATPTNNSSSITMSGNASASSTVVSSWSMNVYPGNGDVWWYNKNAYDVFSSSTIAQNKPSTQAPKGHFISSAWSIDRNTLSGLSGLTSTSSGTDRPSSTAFYAGRVWYAGVNHKEYNANLYFSQILDNIDKAGKCYQEQDPTDENLFDLLPTDGGVVVLNGCGTVHKLFATGSSLYVFASNGVWEVTGNQGIGFTANDYSPNRISSVPAIGHRSFVDVEGLPMWWNVDGIYTLTPGPQGSGGTQVKSLSTGTIQTFVASISNNNKVFVRGAYNGLSKIVQWLYREEETGDLGLSYNYQGILNLNIQTGAFYPWRIDATNSSINDVIILQGASGNVQEVVLTDEDGTTHVVDGSDDVTVFSTLGNIASADFVYPMSTVNGSSYDVNFAFNDQLTYKDWVTTTEKDYESYLISGYQIRGDAQRNFQDNYVVIHGRTVEDAQLYFQGIYDWSIHTDSNKFGTLQLVKLDNLLQQYQNKRLLLRGSGKACQFKVKSVSGKPFDLIGWSVFVTGNTGI